ncbi:hypothetical protein HYX16_06440 [Candidatus Woesearchaeota archaeon]|nr:hypothetical protein [Candidatus Woesearchaeota archaeon]
MTLKNLLERGIVNVARIPRDNDFLIENNKLKLEKLDELKGYTVPLIAHDYGASTPLMWNYLYLQLNLPIRNIMVIGDPENSKEILEDLRNDPRYLGGGAGVGFKEKVIPFLDSIIPGNLKAVNIIVKENSKLVGYNTDTLGFVKSLEESLEKVGKTIQGSNFIVYGAGGVAKEVTKMLAERKARRIRIVNRTFSRAVALAHYINETYDQIAEGIGEELSRGAVLNSEVKVDALLNLSDKGSDGNLLSIAMYDGDHPFNEKNSRDILRQLKNLRPNVLIADITSPKVQPSVSLRLAKAEGIENLLDGKPMVINQAGPAYVFVQNARPDMHSKKVTEEEALKVFKEAMERYS